MAHEVDSLTPELEAQLGPQQNGEGDDDHVPTEGRLNAKRSSENAVINGVSSMHVNGAAHKDPSKALGKNSKKSRSGRGRGEPKKGGAGGKGTWGAPGSEIYETGETKDSNDPNYDSNVEDNEDVIIRAVSPVLTVDELEKKVQPILQEYLEHGVTKEVIDSLDEINVGKNKTKIPGFAVSLGLERHDPQRELMSVLISDMYGSYLTRDEMKGSFDDVLENLADLTIDTPNAPTLVGQFIARAVADDCLPPKFVSGYQGKVEQDQIKTALNKADCLLNMKHGIVRLDNVWGMGGGNRPVKYLTKRIRILLKEYISSGDVAEATKCLTELDVPHFHHEFVYQAILSVIEVEYSERAADMITSLLKSLCDAVIITKDQLSKGILRIYGEISEISLDAPAAYSILEALANKMHKVNCYPDKLFKELPKGRGRKRFVSEGDGGRFKEVKDD